jgi:translation elongation factor EF-G
MNAACDMPKMSSYFELIQKISYRKDGSKKELLQSLKKEIMEFAHSMSEHILKKEQNDREKIILLINRSLSRH